MPTPDHGVYNTVAMPHLREASEVLPRNELQHLSDVQPAKGNSRLGEDKYLNRVLPPCCVSQ